MINKQTVGDVRKMNAQDLADLISLVQEACAVKLMTKNIHEGDSALLNKARREASDLRRTLRNITPNI